MKQLKIKLIVALTILSLSSCTTLKKQLATKQDATLANNLKNPQIKTFRFSDVLALKKILEDRIDKYRIGVAYLNGMASEQDQIERVRLNKEIAQIEMQLNFLEAKVKNLLLVYPDLWTNERVVLDDLVVQMRSKYQKVYQGLVLK